MPTGARQDARKHPHGSSGTLAGVMLPLPLRPATCLNLELVRAEDRLLELAAARYRGLLWRQRVYRDLRRELVWLEMFWDGTETQPLGYQGFGPHSARLQAAPALQRSLAALEHELPGLYAALARAGAPPDRLQARQQQTLAHLAQIAAALGHGSATGAAGVATSVDSLWAAGRAWALACAPGRRSGAAEVEPDPANPFRQPDDFVRLAPELLASDRAADAELRARLGDRGRTLGAGDLRLLFDLLHNGPRSLALLLYLHSFALDAPAHGEAWAAGPCRSARERRRLGRLLYASVARLWRAGLLVLSRLKTPPPPLRVADRTLFGALESDTQGTLGHARTDAGVPEVGRDGWGMPASGGPATLGGATLGETIASVSALGISYLAARVPEYADQARAGIVPDFDPEWDAARSRGQLLAALQGPFGEGGEQVANRARALDEAAYARARSLSRVRYAHRAGLWQRLFQLASSPLERVERRA